MNQQQNPIKWPKSARSALVSKKLKKKKKPKNNGEENKRKSFDEYVKRQTMHAQQKNEPNE